MFAFDRIEEPTHDNWPVVARHIMVDNRDYSSPFHFTVNFDDMKGRYNNVQFAELKSISFPKINGEMYVNMMIDEIPGNLDNKNSYNDEAFAVVMFDSDDQPTGQTKSYKGSDFYRKRNALSPSKTIDKLHITFRKPDGSIVTPSDTAGKTTVTLIIEVTCR